jgi:TolA-binding protein
MRLDAIAFVAGVAGFVLGGIGVYTATVAKDVADTNSEVLDHDGEMADTTFERLTALEEAMRTQTKRLSGLRTEHYQLRDKTRELLLRLEEVEKRRPAAPGEETAGGGDGPSVDLGSSGLEKEEFEALRKKVWDGEASADDEARFWELARTTGALDTILEELEEKADSAPRDITTKMHLAGAYVAKLLTVPDGPERGAWAMKAEAQWGAVLELDPEHWEARYSRAFSWSQWPPFMGKGPTAIKEFEQLVEQQARMTPEPEQANVYLQLSQLYRREGNTERANETLKKGIERHPDTEALQDALDAATK